MIFNVSGHIPMIQNGLASAFIRDLYPDMIIKTQTRRLNRGIYQVGKSYAVQRKRGVKAEPDIRIVFDKIREEIGAGHFASPSGRKFVTAVEMCISREDALAEGGYTPNEYEKLFRELNPKWNGFKRWVFEFYVIEVRK